MENKAKVLFVDDEMHISAMTKEYLVSKNYAVELVHNAMAALEKFQSTEFSMCILDIQMPFKNGYELAQDIRILNPHMPIIFLTGKTEVTDRVKGLKLGADDYITKPYSLEELDLRIQNILSRRNPAAQEANNTITKIGRWHFNPQTRELSSKEKKILLTSKESKLLAMFCEHPERLVERKIALKRIWSDNHNLHGRSLNVYVSKIRKYLSTDERIEILNIHGVGYRMIIK